MNIEFSTSELKLQLRILPRTNYVLYTKIQKRYNQFTWKVALLSHKVVTNYIFNHSQFSTSLIQQMISL